MGEEHKTPTPTEHLDTVEYWKDLYLTSIEVGQEYADKLRAAEAEVRQLDLVVEAARRVSAGMPTNLRWQSPISRLRDALAALDYTEAT